MTTIHGKNVNDFCDRTGSPARRKTKDKQTTKPHKKTYRGEYSKDRTD